MFQRPDRTLTTGAFTTLQFRNATTLHNVAAGSGILTSKKLKHTHQQTEKSRQGILE